MKISSVEFYNVVIPRNTPLQVVIGSSSGVQNVFLKVITDEGLIGWGEASPTAYITGDSLKTNLAAAQELAIVVKGKNPMAIEARMAEINSFIRGEPSIKSAFDMAFYDILGQAAGLPLYKVFGGERRQLRSDLTIGQQGSVTKTIECAEKIMTRNYNAIKLKVGRPCLEDVGHVSALREVTGNEVHIKIDANQGWDLPTAVANLRAMESFNLQYVEQPLKAWDHVNLVRLRQKVIQPLCADESIFDDTDAFKLMTLGSVDYLNIKLGKSGGMRSGIKINAVAEAAGSKCMIGCFAETRLGLTAAAHLAMANPNICFLDLDSADDHQDDPVVGGVTYDEKIGGLMHLNDGLGLGAEIDSSFLKKCVKVVV